MSARIDGSKRAIVIAGPTASGKSALALDLAERLDGTVINADSMQVYADLSVLTARPGSIDMARAPHRLFGHVDAAEAYSVGRWLGDMRAVLDETQSAGLVPIIVGGTGLYLKALMHGLSNIPAVPADVRDRVRAAAAGIDPERLHAMLRMRDPATAARLRPSDPQRILRALEVFEATGRPLSAFQGQRSAAPLPSEQVFGVLLTIERRLLNERIDARFDAMMGAGALDEVARLGARALDPSLPAMRALGVPPLLAHLRGETLMEEAVNASKLLSRQYAKRQVTFFRHQLSELAAFEDAGADAVASSFQTVRDLGRPA